MLDRIAIAVVNRLTNYKTIVSTRRAASERELAGDEAKAHAGTMLRHVEGYSTSLRKTAEAAQQEYAMARREWQADGPTLMAMLSTLMVARERRDDAVKAYQRQQEAEGERKQTGVHPYVRDLFALMFQHGVQPRHVEDMRLETIAIICDLIRWDGHDPAMQDPASPMPQVFGMYASRLILEPGQMGDKLRSVPGTPAHQNQESHPRFYRFDKLAAPGSTFADREEGSGDTLGQDGSRAKADIIGHEVAAPLAEGQGDEATPEPLTPVRAKVFAEAVYDCNPGMLAMYWPPDIQPGDYDPERLMPALQRWSNMSMDYGPADAFLAWARRGDARGYIDAKRRKGVDEFAQRLLNGDPQALADAQAAGLSL